MSMDARRESLSEQINRYLVLGRYDYLPNLKRVYCRVTQVNIFFVVGLVYEISGAYAIESQRAYFFS